MSNNRSRIRPGRILLAMVMTVLLLSGQPFLPGGKHTQTAHAAVALTDIGGHWAKSYIEKAVEAGFVSGYGDGTFRPDNPITRAEFTKMVNAALGVSRVADLDFYDVSQDQWFYPEICKGVAAAYINGNGNGSFSPDNPVTRQEAAVMLSRIVPAYAVNGRLENYSDNGDIASWARPAFNKMAGKTYLGSYSDGLLHPADNLTRAQAAKILSEVLEKEKIIRQNQTVVASAVTLSNTIYTGQISVGEKVGDGITTFTNCTILGMLNVQSGGSDENGITLLNTRVASAKVHKEDTEVRLLAQGETNVIHTVVSDLALLEESALLQNGEFGKGFMDVTLARGAVLSLRGDFETVTASGAKTDVLLKQGKIATLNILQTSDRSVVSLDPGTAVDTLNVSADSTQITGGGTVHLLNACANNITFETEPESIVTDPSVIDPPYQWADPWKALTITVSPRAGETGVPADSAIVLQFSAPVHLADGGSSVLSGTEAASVIRLREGSEAGRIVSVTASVTNSGKTVTLKPDAALSGSTTYYIQIAEGALQDVYAHKNASLTSSFTTGKTANPVTVRVSPTNGALGTALSVHPTLTFSDPVTGSAGQALTAAYLADTVTLKKVDASGVLTPVRSGLSADAENRVITIVPAEPLEPGCTYQMNLDGTRLQREADGAAVPSLSTSFHTLAA